MKGSLCIVISLLFAALVSPVSCQWFYNDRLNCFARCMTCLMTGLDCEPHHPFPSGYEECQFTCLLEYDTLYQTFPAIQSSLHICRETKLRDLNVLNSCVRRHIRVVFPDIDKKLTWIPQTRTAYWRACFFCFKCKIACKIDNIKLILKYISKLRYTKKMLAF